jgi:hypothetical protein
VEVQVAERARERQPKLLVRPASETAVEAMAKRTRYNMYSVGEKQYCMHVVQHFLSLKKPQQDAVRFLRDEEVHGLRSGPWRSHTTTHTGIQYVKAAAPAQAPGVAYASSLCISV